jgi:Type VI secretion system spike protein VgrG3-like, C-terminal
MSHPLRTTLPVLVLLALTSAAIADEPLGKLSEKYESGGRGPATVSTGKGDRGGVSYGTYQLASKVGRADEFVRKYYSEEFKGLKGGSDEFTARWKKLAADDPKGLRANEHRFIQETHYDPLAQRVEKKLGIALDERSHALRDVIWSTAVQHGPNTNVVDMAVKPLLKEKPIEELSDEQIIRAIYAERGRKDESGGLARFRGNSDEVQQAVAGRFENEMRDALEALTKELQED